MNIYTNRLWENPVVTYWQINIYTNRLWEKPVVTAAQHGGSTGAKVVALFKQGVVNGLAPGLNSIRPGSIPEAPRTYRINKKGKHARAFKYR